MKFVKYFALILLLSLPVYAGEQVLSIEDICMFHCSTTLMNEFCSRYERTQAKIEEGTKNPIKKAWRRIVLWDTRNSIRFQKAVEDYQQNKKQTYAFTNSYNNNAVYDTWKDAMYLHEIQEANWQMQQTNMELMQINNNLNTLQYHIMRY